MASNSDWRKPRDQSEDEQQYNRKNKNAYRGSNKRYNDWKEPNRQGLAGDGDGNMQSSSHPEVKAQDPDSNLNKSSSSTSSSSTASSSSPSTVVSRSPNKSDSSSDAEHRQTIFSSGNGDTSSTYAILGNDFSSDSNGNKAELDTDANELGKSNSPTFESASENEDSEMELEDQIHDLSSANGHDKPSAPLATSSFVEIVDSEGEEDNVNRVNEPAVTHASLVVNLNESKNSAIDFRSFTTPSLNDSPLYSSRSAPPDVTVESEPEVVIIEPTSRPLVPTHPNKQDVPEVIVLDDSTEDGEPEQIKGLTGSLKKKNSVSFAPNTIDIDEVIMGRPAASNNDSSGNRPAVSPSILINGSSGGGILPIPSDSQAAGSTSSDDNDDDSDSASTVTSNDPVAVLNSKLETEVQFGAGVTEAGREVDDLAADEEVQEINAAVELPVTTTELAAPNGVKVYVVGTAHFSEKSQQDVIDTIRKVQPNVVVLELCQSRRNILTLDEETILREASDLNLEKVRLAIKQSGYVQGMLHILLLSMSAQITKKLGMAPGGEFRVGLHEASKIPNCMIYLGDRPFGITLSRALAALTLKQKIKLCWQFMTNNEDITKEEIERCKEKDLLEKMLIEMMGEYPSISQVFVNERDVYLAHSLWGAALSAHASVCHSREHAYGHSLNQGHGRNGTVVGVVGMGHVAGIVKHWSRTTEEQISEITIVPEPTLQSIIIRKTMKLTFYALLCYGTYKFSRRVFNFPSDALMSRTITRVPELVNKPWSMFKK